ERRTPMKWNFLKTCRPLPIREALRTRRRQSQRPMPRIRLWLERIEDRTTPHVVDLTSAGCSGTINGPLVVQSTRGAGGTGVAHAFVQMEQNNAIGATTEQGYNTNSRPVQFDEKNSPNFVFQLGSVAEVNNGGTLYYQFLLDINQVNSSPAT